MTKSISFEEIEVGDELPALRLTLSNEDVRRYAVAANMPGGRFMSDEAAKAEGLPGQIVPGNMSLALFSRLLGSWGEGVRLRRSAERFAAWCGPTSRSSSARWSPRSTPATTATSSSATSCWRAPRATVW